MTYESPQSGRTAFHLRKVHENHSRTASITAIALQQDADRLYLGFSDGQLEEYRILAGPAVGIWTLLFLRKQQPVPPSVHVPMQSCTRHGSCVHACKPQKSSQLSRHELSALHPTACLWW